MQTFIVILIVAVAAAFLIRKFLTKFKQQNTCDCGCSSCPVDRATCEEKPENCEAKVNPPEMDGSIH